MVMKGFVHKEAQTPVWQLLLNLCIRHFIRTDGAVLNSSGSFKARFSINYGIQGLRPSSGLAFGP